jgi:hypothetical protein
MGMPTPVTDTQSPNFPVNIAHPSGNNGCSTSRPRATTISVSSVGPSKIKADYSNHGYEEIDAATRAAGSATIRGIPG